MNDEPILLKDYSYTIVNGISTAVLKKSTQVFARSKSVSYNEFYQAEANGFKAEIIFELYAFEYNGEEIIEYNGIDYEVLRTFQKTKDRLELTCKRREEK